MWSFQQPTGHTIDAFLSQQKPLAPSYPEVGATRGDFPVGYNHDRNFCELGRGKAAFEAARQAISSWKMFPASWTRILPSHPPNEGNDVCLVFHLAGLYWLSAARIIYLVDETEETAVDGVKGRFGFAYGTLPGHVEKGEERFTVAWLADDRVVYELQAFSQPRYWMARLGKPLARHWQRRFVRDSQAAMQEAIRSALA
jgi:uncharacterized protein (UPF0548 family)